MNKVKQIYRNRWVRLALGLSVSALLLYLAFRQTTFAAVWLVLSQAHLEWVAVALLCVAANQLFKVIRWQVMLGPPGRQVPFVRLLMSSLSGQMINAVFPVRVGDLSRAYVIGGEGPGRAFVLGTVILEKIIDVLWYGLMMVLLLLLIPLPGWVNDSAWALAVAAFLMGWLTFIMAARRQQLMHLVEFAVRRLPDHWKTYLVSRLHNGLDSLDVLQQRADLVKIALWSALAWAAAILTNQATMLALDIHLDFSASLLVLVAILAGINVAAVPGRIGVFEWACVLALAVYGVGQAQALSYGLLLHAIVYIPMILSGVISFYILARGR
jgi:uncharacterized protein (TIRG00374 family)